MVTVTAVRRKRRTAPADIRLSREDWINAATEALGHYGIDGVQVSKLCKELNVTKGSFYWHFKDRDDLLEAMLDQWRRLNTINVLDYVGSTELPHKRLEKLVRMPFETDLPGDPMGLPIRLWARHDDRARRALDEVDDLRVRMNAQLFQACGMDAMQAQARAVLLYSYMRVAMTLVGSAQSDLRTLCEQLVLGLDTPR